MFSNVYNLFFLVIPMVSPSFTRVDKLPDNRYIYNLCISKTQRKIKTYDPIYICDIDWL